MINNSHCPSWGSFDNGSYGEICKSSSPCVYHLPAAVIDQSEQDVSYPPSTQFSNLDPLSRHADCACSTASLCQRDRLPSTHTPGSDLCVRGSTIGSTDFWLHSPIRPLLGFTFLFIGGKEHPNEGMTLLPFIPRVPRENGIKLTTTRSETCRWFLTSLWFLFCGRNGRLKKADHQEYQSNGLVWSKFRGARYASLLCPLE